VNPSPTTDEEAAIEAGRLAFAQECRFVAGAATYEQILPPALPEIAFAGRSNVGKSSLINALTGRKALARISHTPGRTQQINFFDLGGRLMLVDLPGYGYARASKEAIRLWNRLIEDYLRGRACLCRVCLLIDSRHGIKVTDEAVMALLDTAAVPYQVVLTKADKPSAGALARLCAALETTLAGHAAAHPRLIVSSARTGLGIAALRAEIAGLAAAARLDGDSKLD
jgi:GTP-binding protein